MFMINILNLNLVVIFLALTLSVTVASANSKDINSCLLVKQKVGQGALLIDVRSKEEFLAEKLPMAINIPLEQIEAHKDLLPVDKQREIILFCKSGRRSELARQILDKLGYQKVENAGSYSELLKCWTNN
jgi:phage shock protein E